MSTITQFPASVPAPGDVYRFTVAQYDRMVRDGTIGEDDPVELLDGIVVRKMPKGPRHDASFARCRRQIEPILGAGWYLRLEGSVRIPDYNEPEPDLAVVRGDSDDYTDRHPGPGDVALIVEVAESSLSRDRGEKRDTYGRAGIPVYWIVNLVDRQLEVYAHPPGTSGVRAGGEYPAPTILGESESALLIIAGQAAGQIAVADLLPRR